MIAIKLVLQFLGVFAVGGTVITRAAYKINNDITVEKSNKEEAQKKLEAKIAELNSATKTFNHSSIAFAKIVADIKEKSEEKTKTENEIQQLKQTEDTLNKAIAKLIDEEKVKTAAFNTTNEKEKNLKTDLASANEIINTQTPLLEAAKRVQAEADTLLNNATQAKDNATTANSEATEKKVTDDKAVTDLKQTLQQDQEKERSAIASHTTESQKTVCTPSAIADDQEANPPTIPITCNDALGAVVEENNQQNPGTLTALLKTKEETEAKTIATKGLLQTAEALVVLTDKDLGIKTETLRTTTETFDNAKSTKDGEDKKVKAIEEKINQAENLKTSKTEELKTASPENVETQKALTLCAEEKEKQQKELSNMTSSKTTKEKKLSDLVTELASLKAKETTLNKEVKEQKEIKEKLETELKNFK